MLSILATYDMREHGVDCCGPLVGVGDDVQCVMDPLVCATESKSYGAKWMDCALHALTWEDTVVRAC